MKLHSIYPKDTFMVMFHNVNLEIVKTTQLVVFALKYFT